MGIFTTSDTRQVPLSSHCFWQCVGSPDYAPALYHRVCTGCIVGNPAGCDLVMRSG